MILRGGMRKQPLVNVATVLFLVAAWPAQAA